MGKKRYDEVVEEFEDLVRNRRADRTMVSLIIDSPWLPGYAGLNTLDFYFNSFSWLTAYEDVHKDLPGVAFVPDFWVEFGMANEPSGFGARIQWSKDTPPAMKPFPGGMTALLEADQPDPERDGLMPAVLRQYERMKNELEARDMAPRMAAARGPLAVASHLMGITEFLLATQIEADDCKKLIEKATTLCIDWLGAQLSRMGRPLGVLVLDDVVGMLSPADAERFAFPYLKKIFDAFPGLIHIYHNDTPNKNIYQGLAGIGMDVFNLTHEVDLEEARSLLGPDVVIMGNLPPLELLVRGTRKQVKHATEDILVQAECFGPVLVSPGGGVSPGTPIDNLKAMLEVVENK